MEFRPGTNIKRERGVTYVKDTIQTQVDPPKPVPKQPKKEIKPKKDEAIQQQQVVQKPVSKRGRPKRKQSRSSSKGNGSSNSGS